jgi:hypothetical protein
MKKCIVFFFLFVLGFTVRSSPMALAGETEQVTLTDFNLVGDLTNDNAAFVLTAVAHIRDAKGGMLALLSGPVALTEFIPQNREHIRGAENQFSLAFDRSGDFPVKVKFSARVQQKDGWNSVDFVVAPSVVAPVTLRGLSADTQFQFDRAAKPARRGDVFLSYLPADGAVHFSWKTAHTETEGKLFYSATIMSQISVSPGLMSQAAVLHFKVMQGEVRKLTLRLHGAGDVTRVQGDQVLSSRVEPMPGSDDRRLVIELIQPQKEQFTIQVQAQTPLGSFPLTADAVEIRPENATQFSGYIRLVNEGAVRLEVLKASGMSQISPEQFPQNEAGQPIPAGSQCFAYRFAGSEFALRLHADQVLPELAVSETLGYHLGENEISIDADLELDIREAPLRELLVRVPKGFPIAQLTAAGMSDYFLSDAADGAGADLRIVYGQPISGRQLVQVRLEHNGKLGESVWNLPRLEINQAKSVHGYVGVGADPGLRLTPERTKQLSELGAAFYPGKLDGLQWAFRLTDRAWSAAVRLERLPQTVQASALHLFSIGEGIAYGSSVINFAVSGAPVSTFKIELADEYANVEFTGKDLRNNWQKINGQYVVQLNTPVSGPYTLLATYERPFKASGETLSFTGARPLDVTSEEGYTLVTSAYQFNVKPTDVSDGLLRLDPAEVPSEYRLFFDAPVLAAYRYASRPFQLRLALNPLAQGDSLNQIVDRASFDTRISKEGQVLTEARYFIKNRGNPRFRLSLPGGSRLWSAGINGVPVVPVTDGAACLIPLPQTGGPDAVLELDLKLAAQSPDAEKIRVALPTNDAPVLLSEWKIAPDAGRRLVYDSGSVLPLNAATELSGFAQLSRMFGGADAENVGWLCGALVVIAASIWLGWRKATRDQAYRTGAVAVGLLLAVAAICVVQLTAIASHTTASQPTDLTLLAPVQQGGTALSITVSNITTKLTWGAALGFAWPALIVAILWMGAASRFGRVAALAGWVVLACATLRLPNSAPLFFWVVLAFIFWEAGGSVLRQWRQLPARAANVPLPPSAGGSPAATAAMLAGLLVLANHVSARPIEPPTLPDSVTQSIRVEDQFATGAAHIRWHALKGQLLPLLAKPAVLMHATYPNHGLELTGMSDGSRFSQALIARANGVFDIDVQYQVPLEEQGGDRFTQPVPFGLINRIDLTISGLDVDVACPQAVSTHVEYVGTNTVAKLLLSPARAEVAWHPRSRDVQHEKAVFYADLTQLYVPSAGVLESASKVTIRPAQGELSELTMAVPKGATVTDVAGPMVSLWRFDPDGGTLRLALNPPQSKPFAVTVQTQIATGPLPFETSTGLLSVENAAGQIGLAGIAAGGDVQLDRVTAQGLSPINLEDFPADAISALGEKSPDLTVWRAFRYLDTNAVLQLAASAVQPDVHVVAEDTLSIGEDRTLLAVNLWADITRAGVFNLTFVMPAGYDIESLSGSSLSQWTELTADAGRVITLHLTGKTLGHQTFVLTLAGPGIKTAHHWLAPRVVIREASKQNDSLLIVPEQGMRVAVVTREGYTQLDPRAAGISQKGVLGFRALQAAAALTLDLEQVDPWIRVSSLQHAVVNEAQVKVVANLAYEIENTGLKSLRVLVPVEAEAVRFQGDQLADTAGTPGTTANGLRSWEVKLRRRFIGEYFLQVAYEIPLAATARAVTLRGIEAADVNLQRGFVTMQSDPRLQLTVTTLPAALQRTEWQGIPRALKKDLLPAASDFTYRVVEPAFAMVLGLTRHQAATLLPARVNHIDFDSVISDDGDILTRTRLEIVPGDKRLLKLRLPADARFWFAFVNDAGVWPWLENDDILIPLEQQSAGNTPITVEIFHSAHAGGARGNALDLALVAPKFDLPLENITWKLSLSDKWQVKHWAGSLQLDRQEVVAWTNAADLKSYLQTEQSSHRERSAEAQQFMALANNSLENGRPADARRAFAAAYGLSTDDAAFNEDARVQLHNIKLQQAMVGLNARQSAVTGDTGTMGGKWRDLRGRGEMNYTQQDAKDIIDINTAEENTAYLRLAEKLVQQEDAALSAPSAIRASIPEEGRVLIFKRDVAVDLWADLRVGLQMKTAPVVSNRARWIAAGVTALGFLAFGAGFRIKETV